MKKLDIKKVDSFSHSHKISEGWRSSANKLSIQNKTKQDSVLSIVNLTAYQQLLFAYKTSFLSSFLKITRIAIKPSAEC